MQLVALRMLNEWTDRRRLGILEEFLATAERGDVPPPLVQSPKCRGCSWA